MQALIHQIDECSGIVANDVFDSAAYFLHAHFSDPGRIVWRRRFLEETRLVNAIGKALQSQWPPFEMRQHPSANSLVIADQIAFCDAVLGK